jgi:hypothetical protein
LIKAFLTIRKIFSLYLKINKKTLMKKLILIMAVLPTIASFGQNQNQFNIQKPERGNGRSVF